MDWQEIKNKDEKELRELLADHRAELQSLNFQAHNRQLKQVHKIKLVRKTIARISMLLENIKRASSK